MDQYDIEAIHPDDFINYQIDLLPSKVCQALKKMRVALKKPPYSAKDLVIALGRNQLPITAKVLSEYLDSL